jgi:hypothetical protein
MPCKHQWPISKKRSCWQLLLRLVFFALSVGALNCQVSTVKADAKPITISFWNEKNHGISEAGSDSPVEVGTKFFADGPGQILAIRFYKFPGNAGPHVANVWSSVGSLLGSATFKNETSSGWQEAKLDAAIPIQANTIYVISYHSASGHYAFSKGFFAKPFDAPPLHAPTQAGVFAYGTVSRFPTQTFESANYWVDPILRIVPVQRSERTVTLQWKPSTTPHVSYVVYRRSSQSGDYVRVASGLTAVTYRDRVVAARGEKLYYAVSCVDDKHQESRYSNEAQITVP